MTGYFQDDKGNKSSSRLSSFIVTMAAIALSEQVLLFAYLGKSDILLAAASAGTTFISIAGPSMYFMYNQKKMEEQSIEK